MNKRNLAISFGFLFCSFLVGHAQDQTLSCNASNDSYPAMSCTVAGTPVHCGSAVGDWGWDPPYYSSGPHYIVENQDSNGNLTGHFQEDYVGSAPLSGHYDPSSGTGWWRVDWSEEQGAGYEYDFIQIHPPGCNTQTNFWAVNETASPGNSPWEVYFRYADIPNGQPAETDIFNSWAPTPNETSGLWDQTLSPSIVDFSGRVVTEETYPDNDPVYHSADSCHFQDSEVPEATNSSTFQGGTWIVHANNNFGWDMVGASEFVTNYYQLNENPSSFPCGFRVYQKMVVYENDSDYYYNLFFYSKPYQTNQLGADIWPADVATLKSGTTVTKDWP